jgi:L-lactate dehydrogenase complex protein LldG
MTPQTKSKRAIMDRIGTRIIDSAPLPTLDSSKLTHFDDPLAKFIEMLTLVGGQAHCIDGAQEAKAILDSIPVFADAHQVASLVPAAVEGNVDAWAVDDPHTLASLDWVIARGEFIVAENGAIWVDGSTMPHRVMLFIPQYLALVVSRSQVVHHMHEAYARIGHPKPGFGVFVSGPSKTADIEQSLVLGAHGCRTLQVFLTP